MRVHRHLHRFDQSRQFSTWIYTIATNLARNELRNRGRTPLVSSETPHSGAEYSPALQFEDSRSRPDVMYRQRYLTDAIDRSLAKLSGRHREVFVLRELEGKSYEDIAAITHSTLGTIKSRLSRARRSFAVEIEPFLE